MPKKDINNRYLKTIKHQKVNISNKQTKELKIWQKILIISILLVCCIGSIVAIVYLTLPK